MDTEEEKKNVPDGKRRKMLELEIVIKVLLLSILYVLRCSWGWKYRKKQKTDNIWTGDVRKPPQIETIERSDGGKKRKLTARWQLKSASGRDWIYFLIYWEKTKEKQI